MNMAWNSTRGARCGRMLVCFALGAGCAATQQVTVRPPAHQVLSRADVDAAVSRRSPALRSCYDAAGRPTATIRVDLRIAPAGQISELRIVDLDGADESFGSCLVDVLSTIRFAPTREGLRTNYELVFTAPPERRRRPMNIASSGMRSA